MTTTTDITATAIIAWSAPSPSSPAPAARRCAALELDRSARPSKLADRAADESLSMFENENQPSQKSLTQNFRHSLGRELPLQPAGDLLRRPLQRELLRDAPS